MATATVAPEVVGTRDRPATAWQVARWLTLALCALTFLTGPLTGARTASYGDLQSALERGAVTQVVVESPIGVPEGYGDGVQGVSTVRLLWQDGWHRSVVEMKQASSLGEMRSQGFEPAPGGQIIGDVGQELRRLSSGDVEIVRSEWQAGTQASLLAGSSEVPGAICRWCCCWPSSRSS